VVLWNLCETFDLRRSIDRALWWTWSVYQVLLEAQDRANQHLHQYHSSVLNQIIEGAATVN
jgi:hypothetical protein